MTARTVTQRIRGMATSDGAGVKLTRVLTQPLQPPVGGATVG